MSLDVNDLGLGEHAKQNSILQWFFGVLGIKMGESVNEVMVEGEVLIGHIGPENKTTISTLDLKR